MTKKINLTVATSINGKGGISTVLNVLQQAHFFKQTNNQLIASHTNGNTLFGLGRLTSFMSSIIKIFYFGMFKRLNIVHIHMASRGSYTRKSIIIRIVRILGGKIIIHLHGADFKIFYADESTQKKQQHIRETFNMADSVIVLSSQWLEWVNCIVEDNSKTCVVYNAVPEIDLPATKSLNNIILFMGRLGERKGVTDLIDAYAKLAAKFPNSRLHLGGDGDLELYQRKVDELGITEQVTLLGWVSGQAKKQCLADATIFCLPSYNEGFPMGVLEAMSANITVVASRAGGIPDAITDKQEGLLIDAGDVDALASALSTLLSDVELRRSLSAAAKIKYKDNFSPEVIVPQLIQIYEQLSGDKR